MQTLVKLTIILFFISVQLQGQESEIDRLIANEFKMTFPSIYFKNKSTDYAKMPYSVDSCFKYIAEHFDKTINSLVIWRDSSENESLTNHRIKKLKVSLRKYMKDKNVEIYSMGNEQKISDRTIKSTNESTKIAYLLSLNSVFDISKSRIAKEKYPKGQNHVQRPRLSCWDCWKNGFHLQTRMKLRKAEKRNKKKNKQT